ncbi:winged helix-turn-helix domain-containing protein [Nonomuraea soli]|uniref:DNA-binding GntR family transcriptional regulator n=1 Tax=Nonomuraea soli TaxID=1032476 RepID=A0A7W0CJ33_9ACTN|nr:winged helix-turn-helix domain-containing protein [Nonomuraea soli]MBA2892108.1 DNA-binding GntR family transcriptional regulator [Nonomuraea soli]
MSSVGDVANVRKVTVDRFDPTPIYRQLAELVIADIRAGKLQPRDRIPSESQMVQEHGVARDTARQAVQYLREQGWAFTLPQRGTFVAAFEEWPTSREG